MKQLNREVAPINHNRRGKHVLVLEKGHKSPIEFDSIKAVTRRYYVTDGTVRFILKGKAKTKSSVLFKYIDEIKLAEDKDL